MFGFDDIIGQGLKIVNKFIPDKEQAAKLQAELSSEFMKYESKFVSYQKEIIVAETKSESYLARNWRPIMMLSFVVVVVNNYMLAPYLKMFGVPYIIMEIPPDMWDLLKLGISGYIVGRSAEKGIKTWKEK